MMAHRILVGCTVAVLIILFARTGSSESPEIDNNAVLEASADDGSRFSVYPASKDKDIYGIYESAVRNNEPLWITTDVVFHTAWRLFSFALRSSEKEESRPLLLKLSTALSEAAFRLFESLPPGEARQAAVSVAAYFIRGRPGS
jgi:hypothetical protein